MVPLLIMLGSLLSLGLLADLLSSRVGIPRVSLLLLSGLAIGPAGLDLLPGAVLANFELLSVVALSMVAFLLGGSLTRQTLAAHGRAVLAVSAVVVIMTTLGVAAGLWVLGAPAGLAFLMGAIATATAPAATLDVIRQSGRTGDFAETLKGIVAVDDLWGLLVFGVVVAFLGVADAQETAAPGHLMSILIEIGGSMALGAALGLPAAWLTGRIKPGEPQLVEALGLVFLIAGLALWLGLSYLLAAITAGAVVVNCARHHRSAFHEIELVQWPFMILFFTMAGALTDPSELLRIGGLGVGYLGLRIAMRLAGGWIGGHLGGLRGAEPRWIGAALLPQAGIAVGMALAAAQAFPEWSEAIVALAVGSTMVFELVGPLATLMALRRTDPTPKKRRGSG